MLLAQWIDGRCEHQRCSRNELYDTMVRLLRSAGTPVSKHTIAACDKGMKLTKYPVAKAISDITLGKVTVKELCE